MNQKKPSLKEKMGYWFDNIMSKGTIALVGMLFLITAIVVIFAGLLASVLRNDVTAGNLIWQSLMHALDAGTLAGDDTTNILFVIVMSIVTICGIFVTSILIGIISTGFEAKLNELRKGTSKVLEANHVIILGFNDSIYTILNELIEAGSNQKKACIVILGEEEKEVMEESIRGHIEEFKTTNVICRSGKLTESYLYERSSLETARSIIINQENDFAVIKTILALVQYLKSKKTFEREFHITATIHSKSNLEAARIAGEGKVEVLFFEDTLARIIAHTCRQPGLSSVLTEFFDFEGDEFYFENFPELEGKSFGECLNLFEKSAVIGIEQDGEVLLNPPMATVLHETDLIIHLAEDDGASKPLEQPPVITKEQLKLPKKETGDNTDRNNLLVLGYNTFLPDILKELDCYAEKGTKTVVAFDKDVEEVALERSYENIDLNIVECNIYERKVLESLLEQDAFSNILLLSDLECEIDDSDAKTLLLLIQLRDIINKWGIELNITSEMRSASNQKLAKVAAVNDFVVGSSLTNQIITQVSENRRLTALFEDLLDADGSELYMKKAEKYCIPGEETNFFVITEQARIKEEVAVGYKKMSGGSMEVIINPNKSDSIVLEKEDFVIVISEDNK